MTKLRFEYPINYIARIFCEQNMNDLQTFQNFAIFEMYACVDKHESVKMTTVNEWASQTSYQHQYPFVVGS